MKKLTEIELAANSERERIIKMFEEMADHLDTMRPASYKSVADKADLRIRTIRFMIEKLKEE